MSLRKLSKASGKATYLRFRRHSNVWFAKTSYKKNDSRCYLESDILCFYLWMKLDNSNERYLSLLVFKFFSILLMCSVKWMKLSDCVRNLKWNRWNEIICALSSVLFRGVVWKWYCSKVCMRRLNRKDHVTYQFLITRISVSVYSRGNVSLHDKNHVLWNYQFSFHVNLLMLWHWDENWKLICKAQLTFKKYISW